MPHRTGTRRPGWINRALSLLLAAVLLIGAVPGLTMPASAHWADEYLNQLVDWGFMRADQIGNPDEPINRAQFVAIINRAYGYTEMGEIPFTDVSFDDWFYDEFIRQRHEPSFSGEFDAIMGAYETFNRNREFDGSPAMRFWAVSNAVDIYNVLFKGLHLVHDAERMAASGKQHRYYKDRRLAIHLMQPTEAFRQMKAKTALAQLTKGTEYYDMAFNNDFAYNDFSLIKYQPLTGYRPYAALDDAYIYCKKGEERYYVCYAKCKCERFNSKLRQDVMSFQRNYGVRLVSPFRDGRIYFESYELKELIIGVIL